MTTPIILAIAGCSGSGKTTLARELAADLAAPLLPLDLYYRDLAHLPPARRALQNFDHPDSLEISLLLEHIQSLTAGHPIHAPTYDFASHTRIPHSTQQIPTTKFLIVEGILALHFAELRPLYSLSVFVETPHDLCLTRRIHRDVAERGRTESSVRQQFADTALPMANRFVIPSAAHANLVVQGTDSLDWSVEQVLTSLRKLQPGK